MASSLWPALLQLAGATGAGIAQGKTLRRQNRLEDDRIARENALFEWTKQRQESQDRMARESHALTVLQALAPGSRILAGRAPQPDATPVYDEGSAADALAASSARAGASAFGTAPLSGASPLPSTPRPRVSPDRYLQSGDFYADTEALDPKTARTREQRVSAQRALRAQFPDLVPAQDLPEVDWAAQFPSLTTATTARASAQQATQGRAAALLATIRGQDLAHTDRTAALAFQQDKEAWDRAHPKSTVSPTEARRLAKASEGLSKNNQAIRTIELVRAAVEKNRSAFGLRNTRVGRVASALGGTGDLYEQRVNPGGSKDHINARALLSRLGSIEIHNITGAAMAAQEWERLKGSIPINTEHSDVILQKLDAMRRLIEQENDAISATYGVENPDRQAPSLRPADADLARQNPAYAEWLKNRGARP